ncbi:unnamed protein product [Linum tenue]|uniref:Uncharacterized protein n=1 Tax=Linum tenue TaxID=586396 RepID=A0AAV0RLR8_9ROSI|nr:unnamed protein product [Linum tenue]
MSNTQQKPEMQGVGGTTLLNQALLELICCLHHPNALSMGLLSEGSTSTSWAKLEGCSFKSFQRGHSRHKLKSIKEQSFSQQRSHTKLLSINATSGSQPLESDPEAYGAPNSASDLVKNAFDAFYRFSRPHTVVGTALSIVSVSLLSIDKLADISPLFFTGMLEAVAAALMMNIYIVGLNQLTDIDIDKVTVAELMNR